jgi:GH24 family phage-related lysozyme (muramidase)
MAKKPWEMGLKEKAATATPKKPWEMNLSSEPKTYLGAEAVSQVEKREGRSLSLSEKRVVEEEGYVSGTYKDDKGIETSGVGQTGKWKGKTFKETFDAHEADTKRMVKGFDTLPEYLQAELVQATYRGDVQQSPRAIKLLEEGKYGEAATELLDHKEYKDRKAKGDDGVTRRLEALQSAIRKYGKEKGVQ